MSLEPYMNVKDVDIMVVDYLLSETMNLGSLYLKVVGFPWNINELSSISGICIPNGSVSHVYVSWVGRPNVGSLSRKPIYCK